MLLSVCQVVVVKFVVLYVVVVDNVVSRFVLYVVIVAFVVLYVVVVE